MTVLYKNTILVAALVAGLAAIPAVYANPTGHNQGTVIGQTAKPVPTVPGTMMGGKTFNGQTPMMMGRNMMANQNATGQQDWMHNMLNNIPAEQRAFINKMMQQHGFNQPNTK